MPQIQLPLDELRNDFTPIFQEWRGWVERYTDEVDPQDALYWYNERANVGTLAAAAARTGSYALEEYRTPKAHESEQWPGRADLWLRCGSRQYIAEAKHLPVSSAMKPGTLSTTVDAYLKAACADAACHPPSDGCRELGVVFVVPYLARSSHGRRSDYVQTFQATMGTMAIDTCAFAFPRGGGPVNASGYQYPGVACCVRYVESRLV